MTDSLATLRAKVDNRTAHIAVIGLGYVGLPVACVFAAAGFKVTGIDILQERVDAINAGESPLEGEEPGLGDLLREVVARRQLTASTDYTGIATADVVTLNVQTPVDPEQRPDYSALTAASRSVGTHLRDGALVIVESTVSPGTTLGVVKPVIEAASKGREGMSFFIGACPERVMPGKLLSNIRTVARVCGGTSLEVAETMRALYAHVVAADIDCAEVTTAELVKVVENTYRDVQIAFANEIALVCADLGEDVWRVRELVNKVPYRDMHSPGGGVGGHCIPKDPWLLAASVKSGLRLIPAARAVNDSMPLEIARLVKRALEALGHDGSPDRQGRVLLLGLAYLPESDDDRNSPSAVLASELRLKGAEVVIHDPFVPGYQADAIELAAASDVTVLMVNHKAYEGFRSANGFFVDARHLSDARRRLDLLVGTHTDA
jgi:UDP-N-acetyl-D-mannosaminuronic acid dehydrogenase